ncbi:MAG TPA: serine/threonine-protein kinase, partial [Polyangia bacterium]|nr:serine/threonine-protein kinase [Polyangia bacterium]
MSPPREQDPNVQGGEDVQTLDPFPGRLIAGNFRIERLIGQGAMGNVYKAEQLSLGKAVAIKILHAHLMDDEKLVGRFKREAKSASKLNHPNSIQIIDSGQESDGTLYIAMELLAGRDLAQVIRDEFPLSLPRVIRIMTQVMSALDEAHAHGVIHRDLKPSNIMLIERRGEKDFVKVCDFGIAKATSADGKEEDRQQMLTIQGLVCGTPEYMAPEQARAEVLDGRADLYSAAVILYQLVTGDIPFRADSPMGIVSRHLAEVPIRPSTRRPDLPIPKALDDLILRGMEKDRQKRFPTAVDFRAALEAIVSPTPGQFTPVPPSMQATANALAPAATAMIPPQTPAEK